MTYLHNNSSKSISSNTVIAMFNRILPPLLLGSPDLPHKAEAEPFEVTFTAPQPPAEDEAIKGTSAGKATPDVTATALRTMQLEDVEHETTAPIVAAPFIPLNERERLGATGADQSYPQVIFHCELSGNLTVYIGECEHL